jgi:hypothetical protein
LTVRFQDQQGYGECREQNPKITLHEIAPDRWHLRFGVLFTDANHGVVCCVSPSPTHAN